MLEQLDVVGAVILRNGRVFCAQRGQSTALAGFWEFPGGKVEPGESPQTALKREILEELDCEVIIGAKIATTIHDYAFARVRLTTYYCEITRGTPSISNHQAAVWLEPRELSSIDWAAADIPTMNSVRLTLAEEA